MKKNHKNEAENENEINVPPELTQTVIKVRTKSKKKLKRLKKFWTLENFPMFKILKECNVLNCNSKPFAISTS